VAGCSQKVMDSENERFDSGSDLYLKQTVMV
jgi:hypothetical protein